MEKLLALIFFGYISVVCSISCKDQNNKDVDWFITYKMPKQADSSPPGIANGVGFYYMDSNLAGDLKPSTNDLSSSDQAIAYTLQQYYSQQSNSDLFHVMYNDEMAASLEEKSGSGWGWLKEKLKSVLKSKAVEYGHTKGVVFFDNNAGYWLVHSVPKFPLSDSYVYPDNGMVYAQSMLCMSFKYSELSKIGTQLYYNHPQIYSSNLPTSMASDNPDLAKVIGGQYKSGAPYSSTLDLTTAGGTTFKSFAKSADFKQDLYASLVAPTLKTPLDVESWRRGDEIPQNCSLKYEVQNVEDMKVGTSTTFKYTKDHSKVGISTQSSAPYTCIGDINRMTSQFVRGGGTICINNAAVWTTYFQMIATADTC